MAIKAARALVPLDSEAIFIRSKSVSTDSSIATSPNTSVVWTDAELMANVSSPGEGVGDASAMVRAKGTVTR
ncbi:hypothetical protein ASE12_14355 [Aeromicrobium sp. Root236]|nr:hypothetical protein ASE12_14355 [Aeromicrobium sp. Root236]